MKDYGWPIRSEDIFCHYCEMQYKTTWGFKRHIIIRHGLGIASRLGILTDEEEAERLRSVAEEGLSDKP